MMEPVYDVDGIQIWHADCADVLPTIDPATVGLLLTDPPYGIGLNCDFSWRMNVGDAPSTMNNQWNDIDGDETTFDPTHLLVYKRCVIFGGNYFDLPMGKWLVWNKRDEGKQTKGNDGELAWHNLSGSTVSIFNWYWQGRFRTGEIGSFLHPAQKPVALMRWILDQWTEPGDLILDPYMGSGPIARACADLGRRYIGIELVEEYVQAAIDRLGQTTLDLNQ